MKVFDVNGDGAMQFEEFRGIHTSTTTSDNDGIVMIIIVMMVMLAMIVIMIIMMPHYLRLYMYTNNQFQFLF